MDFFPSKLLDSSALIRRVFSVTHTIGQRRVLDESMVTSVYLICAISLMRRSSGDFFVSTLCYHRNSETISYSWCYRQKVTPGFCFGAILHARKTMENILCKGFRRSNVGTRGTCHCLKSIAFCSFMWTVRCPHRIHFQRGWGLSLTNCGLLGPQEIEGKLWLKIRRAR